MGDYKGMTVNERLYVSGMMDKFEKAVEEKSINEVISILKSVDLDEKNIKAILEQHSLDDLDELNVHH